MKKFLFIGFLSALIYSCVSTATVVPEKIENNALEFEIAELETGSNGFEQVTISLKNNSNKELEFSAQSFFEDAEGHYNIVNLPSKMHPGVTRKVNLRRTYYKAEGQTSFGFTGDFWGITGFELDSSSGWKVSTSDLDVHDIYLTLIFKIDGKVYTNSYHLNN
jgi:hypothetical protein